MIVVSHNYCTQQQYRNETQTRGKTCLKHCCQEHTLRFVFIIKNRLSYRVFFLILLYWTLILPQKMQCTVLSLIDGSFCRGNVLKSMSNLICYYFIYFTTGKNKYFQIFTSKFQSHFICFNLCIWGMIYNCSFLSDRYYRVPWRVYTFICSHMMLWGKIPTQLESLSAFSPYFTILIL